MDRGVESSPNTSDNEFDTVTPQEVQRLLENSEIELIDVREPEEIVQEYIDGAIFISNTVIDIKQIHVSEKRIVIHCRSGKRGEAACRKLKSQNPSLRISNMKGGILAWIEAGLPIKYINKTMPIMRQVQLIAGGLVAGGTVAALLTKSNWFLAIPAFVGSGLMFAGATGWCGMKELLKCLPWNK